MKPTKKDPTAFCKALITRELEEYKNKKIHTPYWPIIERLINRADELEPVFSEIVKSFGYPDKYESNYRTIWLILEQMWLSSYFCKKNIVTKRDEFKELTTLRKRIIESSSQLADDLRRQSELYETSGFQRNDYQTVLNMIEEASKDNDLYRGHLSPKLNTLGGQYNLKYWPSPADFVEAIGSFEDDQPNSSHDQLPDVVIEGRVNDVKDFVLAFDNIFDEVNCLPNTFRFTPKAMAEIINIVLNLSPDKLIAPKTVSNIRSKYRLAE